MVDINGKSYSDIIKIKGTDKKIDLTKLEGLQRTEQNKAIFDMVDKNKDGVINKEEARMLQGNLLTGSGGNGKLSKSEANNAYGKQMNAFEAISALADQQKAIGEGKEYIEQNGKSTTRIYNSNVSDEYSYRADTDENGVTTTRLNDGSQEIQHKDGSRQEIKSDGTVISYDKDGKKTSVIIDGNTTTFPDANNSITKNAEGKVIQTTSFNDGVIVRTDFEYQDGKTIERAYSDVGDNAPLTGITVKEKKDGHNVDTKFATEEDMANNKPSEIVTDAHNPTQKTVTKFTYNEDGTYSTETTNSAGDKTVKNFNADGTEIVEPQKPEVPTTHTVVKGESITKIVTDALAQQGIENPTPEQLKEAKKEFLEANKDLVKTYKGVKKEWHGNKFFYPDDVVKIPNFVKEDSAAVTEGNTDSTVKGNNPTDENTEVTDENTVVDNGTEVVETQLTEEELSFINEFDSNDSSTISKEEFTALINDQLANLPPAVAEANTEQIQTLIDEAFAKIDAQNKDSELSQAELKQNFNTAVAELTGKIDQLEAASSSATTEVENDSKDTPTLTVTDGSNYDPKNDNVIVQYDTLISNLEASLKSVEDKYGFERGSNKGFFSMPKDEYQQYSNLELQQNSIKWNLEQYQRLMNNWEDGKTAMQSFNGSPPRETTYVTLSNGQRAYKIEGQYYEVDQFGLPGNKIDIEE